MQDQGKRLLLAVALALGVFLVWSTFARKDEPPKPAPGQASGKASGSTPGSGSGAVAAPGQPAPVAHIGPPDAGSGQSPAPPAEAATITLPFERFVATFSSACGGLTSWKLTDARYKRDATGGELLPIRAQMKEVDSSGKPVPVSPEHLANLPACGTFDVNFVTSGSTYFVPRGAAWKGEKLSSTKVRYSYGSASDPLEVVKEFTLTPEDYFVRMDVTVTVHPPEGSEAHEQLAVTAYAFQDPARAQERFEPDRGARLVVGDAARRRDHHDRRQRGDRGSPVRAIARA